MRKRLTTDRRIELYSTRGWCPVPWSHLPPEIKAEIRRIGFVPKMKSCYENCARFVLYTELPGIEYHEGYASGASLLGIPIEHAWLTWNGKVVDLTLPPGGEYHESHTYTKDEIRKTLCRTMVWGPVNEPKLWELHPNRALYEKLLRGSTG